MSEDLLVKVADPTVAVSQVGDVYDAEVVTSGTRAVIYGPARTLWDEMSPGPTPVSHLIEIYRIETSLPETIAAFHVFGLLLELAQSGVIAFEGTIPLASGLVDIIDRSQTEIALSKSAGSCKTDCGPR